jgi:hypothetical protein
MDDRLILAGGGSTAVAVDELFVEVARLHRLAAAARDWGRRLASITSSLQALGLTSSSAGFLPSRFDASAVDAGLGGAASAITRSIRLAERLGRDLMSSAERYGRAEREAVERWRFLVGAAAWAVGAAPLYAAATAATIAGATWLAAETNAVPSVDRIDWRPVFSSPEFVSLVRALADSPDELAAGGAHVPLAESLRAGDRLGAPSAAAVLLAAAAMIAGTGRSAGAVGTAGAGPVLVERDLGIVQARTVHPQPGAPLPTAPRGVAELAARIPSPEPGAPQVRVERYGEGADARYIAYVTGTVTFDVHAGSEPFDMTSNLHGVADDAPSANVPPAAMERAVRLALAEAGAGTSSPVLVAAYSGGGIAAAQLAAASDLNVVGAVTFGSPTASAPPSDGVPVLAFEHAEDPVPATGGAGAPSPDRLVVARAALDGAVIAPDDVLPGHALSRYRETARLVDASEEARLVAFRQTVAGFAEGGATEVTSFRFDREASAD